MPKQRRKTISQTKHERYNVGVDNRRYLTRSSLIRQVWRCFNHTAHSYEIHVSSDTRRRGERRFRSPDMLVFLGKRPPEEAPSAPPFITIEVLSPDDSMSEITGKLEEYWQWGCQHNWLIDPQQRKLYTYGPQLAFTSSYSIPGENWSITPADLFE